MPGAVEVPKAVSVVVVICLCGKLPPPSVPKALPVRGAQGGFRLFGASYRTTVQAAGNKWGRGRGLAVTTNLVPPAPPPDPGGVPRVTSPKLRISHRRGLQLLSPMPKALVSGARPAGLGRDLPPCSSGLGARVAARAG